MRERHAEVCDGGPPEVCFDAKQTRLSWVIAKKRSPHLNPAAEASIRNTRIACSGSHVKALANHFAKTILPVATSSKDREFRAFESLDRTRSHHHLFRLELNEVRPPRWSPLEHDTGGPIA